ncbi:alcohol dehydrogenase catalytic domain-containing protein [Anaerofustis sp.]|uniref:alcohol dehydrogenase catalytic domain-containing protein n=1 Tax=Anaerofustis sp. TaxID=1872517 RepID=UPI00345A9905
MRKVMLYEPGDLRIVECEKPKPKKGEVLIKNMVSLTCGSDVKSYIRGYAKHTPPYNIGHEASGIVDSVGEGVSKFKVGDRVVAHNSAPCNECYYCKKGIHSMCENLISNNLKNGAFSEYQLIPAKIVEQNMFKIPEDMSFKQAALLEPFACAVYGVSQVPVEQGDYVVVNGCGPSGLMFIKLLYLKGARVIACDKSKVRLDAAKKLGAYDVVNIEEVENQVEAVKALTPENRGVDCAVEAAGSVKVWEMSINMVRPGGFALLYGGTKAGEELVVDTKLLHYSQITIKGLYHTTPFYVNQAFELLKMKVIDEKDFLYNEYKLENVKEALMNHHEGNVIKNFITY